MTITTTPPLEQLNLEEDTEMLVPNSAAAVVDGPQPMEVQVENTSTMDPVAVEDPPSRRFTWTIDNFSRLQKKHYSDVFIVGGCKWQILIFPKGNNAEHLSMYVGVADASSKPYGWTGFAQFSLTVVNQVHSKYSIRKETQHQFNRRESDWGFTNFMPLAELYDPSRGYVVEDRCIIEADVNVRKDHAYRAHISKTETGCVGLKNQGATCYMNSLLQTLYHIPYFRKAVYNMPTTENDTPSGSIPLALQSLFYKLQYNDSSVSTKELTKSFGWDTYDSFVQHDVHELTRILCEKLEDKMKGTVVESTIQKLFEGHHMNYIECMNVDYKSARKESFYDLQLDVKGCTDVYASFDKYVEVEQLEGDNKYHAEQYGLQEARKSVLFIEFPPVLQLQLKRFEYDSARDTMVKINDRYEFPLQLDLDRDNGKYLSPDADRSIRNLYTLHSVLVHSGGVHGGHYYAYIRPTLSNHWFKFDDEHVMKEDTNRALEEQYGGEEELRLTNPGFNNSPFKFTKYSNAYVLFYVRESDKDKIICNVDEKDIAGHLQIRLKKEKEEKEKKKKEKAEAHLYTIVKIARDHDLHEQIGKDIFFDLVDHDKVRSFRIQKQMPFTIFKEEVAKEFGIPVEYQRYWMWAKRQNHTFRPSRPVTALEETHAVGQLGEVSNKANNGELKLFLEIEMGQDLRPIRPPVKLKEDSLLFFKLYEPSSQKLSYVGRIFVADSRKPADILKKLNEMAGFNPNEEIDLFVEIKFDPKIMCVKVDRKSIFYDNQLEDGDIICFQKSPSVGDGQQQYRYPDVRSFFKYVQNRQSILKDFYLCEQSEARQLSLTELPDLPKKCQSKLPALPKDLALEVFARVPVSRVFRFKLLSKDWMDSLTTQTFLQSHVEFSPAENACFFASFGREQNTSMYNPVMKHWKHLEVKYGVPISSAGGLICFKNNVGSLFVGNPLTRCLKKLPEGTLTCQVLGMTLNGNGGYKVVKLGYRGKFEVFDSETKIWNVGTTSEYRCRKLGFFSNSVSTGEKIYFLFDDPKAIVSYDTSTGVWRHHFVKDNTNLDHLHLAEYSDRIMLVGVKVQWNLFQSLFQSLIILEEDICHSLVEVDRIVLEKFRNCHVTMTCLGSKGGYILCSLKCSKLYSLVLYDIQCKKWTEIDLPFQQEIHQEAIEYGIAFEPSLAAP